MQVDQKREASICLAVSCIQCQHILRAHQQIGLSFSAIQHGRFSPVSTFHCSHIVVDTWMTLWELDQGWVVWIASHGEGVTF